VADDAVTNKFNSSIEESENDSEEELELEIEVENIEEGNTSEVEKKD